MGRMPKLDHDAPPATAAAAATAGAGAIVVDAALVRAHQDAVWRWLRVLGARADEADDLTQEVFAQLLATPLADQGPAALRVWLRTTARNLFLAHCRRAQRSPLAVDPEALEQAWAGYERDDDGNGYRAALRACLATLPARQRELLELQVHDRADLPQLAAAAGLALEGAKSLLRRLKQALRDCVRRRLIDG
jgi:RNA polymerase sigma-70 factor, ECF subfamily